MDYKAIYQTPMAWGNQWRNAAGDTVGSILKSPLGDKSWCPETLKVAAGTELKDKNDQKINGAMVRSAIDVTAFITGLLQELQFLAPIAQGFEWVNGQVPESMQKIIGSNGFKVGTVLASPNTAASYTAARGVGYIVRQVVLAGQTAQKDGVMALVNKIGVRNASFFAFALLATSTLLYNAHKFQELPSLAKGLFDGSAMAGTKVAESRDAAAQNVQAYEAWKAEMKTLVDEEKARREKADAVEALKVKHDEAVAAWDNAGQPAEVDAETVVAREEAKAAHEAAADELAQMRAEQEINTAIETLKKDDRASRAWSTFVPFWAKKA